MKTVKVTYKVSSNFAVQNMDNIKAFIEDIKKMNDPAIRYVSYLGSDKQTFTHIASFENDEAQKRFLSLPSFKSFQVKRDESGLEIGQDIDELSLVAATYKLFD
ncbi:hypothetical protein SAMN04488029_3422 [Reichenbachiella faecimaris]|uniref:Quinol monooxygenase YgiN n=1 Tax=Reichenbachiella faecimaris TaxID=692418 RepID=A0A1W2GM26_REIFA|nr:hypothetical protein [Reichenbachiella faecimaris]SMD37709.1 hypothetical protein SAMN04488029_3422 [Reichenbachiella faecimaris]